MTTARSQLIVPEVTPYYHCVSRCVRRSFLCGDDPLSGRSYEHRRGWVEERILTLGTIYCIDICAYAVMSNHYHLVVRIDQVTSQALTPTDVITRWGTEHHLPPLIQRFLSGQLTTQAEFNACHDIIETWRARLGSLSWFMKELNYAIARQANQEDECTGRFWEGRFKSQALLDDKALLAAMAYVDLNPVRANQADTPEQSSYTSLNTRLKALSQGVFQVSGLMDFCSNCAIVKTKAIPFSFIEYLEVVDWVGKHIRHNGKGHVNHRAPEILSRLSLSQRQCLSLCYQLERKSRLWIGSAQHLYAAKVKLKRQRMLGQII